MKHLYSFLLAAICASLTLSAQVPLFTNYKQGGLNAPEFTTNNFKCIGVGKGNVIWAGTQYGGLYLYNDTFDVWRKSSQLTNVFINDIKADGDSGIWVAQSGTQSFNTNNTNIAGGINYFRLGSDANSNMKFYSVTGTTTDAGLVSRNVRSLYIDQSYKEAKNQLPRVWAAQGTYITSFKTVRGGLSIGINDIYTPPYPETFFTTVTDSFEITRDATPICEAIGGDSKEVWVAVRQNFNKSQILRYDNTGKCIGVYSGGSSATPLLQSGFTAQAIFCDAQGNRWIGMKSGGLVIKTPKNGWVKMDAVSKIPAGTAINYNAIAADEFGNIYIGTSNGLLVYASPIYNPSSTPDNVNAYTLYTEIDGLANNNVTGIAYDKKNGKILITTSGGVSFMNVKQPFIKGVVFDVFTSIDSLNDYAGLQRRPVSSEAKVTLLREGVEEETVTPDANGVFELKKAEDLKSYTIEVVYTRDGKRIKYLYNNIRNHTLMLPTYIPDSLISEIKAFKPKLENRCFNIKFPFLPEFNSICWEGFNTTSYEQAYQPFYDAGGIETDHNKRVDNLANYYASLKTVYELGGHATSLNTDMVSNTMDAIESLSAWVKYSFSAEEKDDESLYKKNKDWSVSMLRAMKETVNLGLGKAASYITEPETKKIFDQSVSYFNDAADLVIDAADLSIGSNGKFTRKMIIDNVKKIIAAEWAGAFYKIYYALTRHYDFIPRSSIAAKNARSAFTYTETFDNLYSPSANSLMKYGKDTLDNRKAKIEFLGKVSKIADVTAAVLDAASALGLASGAGAVAGIIAKGAATTAKVVKTAALTDAMYQGAVGCYEEVLLSDKILPKAGLRIGSDPVNNRVQDHSSQRSPATLLAAKNNYNNKLTELQAIYNAPYNNAVYRAKILDVSKEEPLYTDEMTKTLNALWASADSAAAKIPGFKGRLNKVIDSFVTQQYTLRYAFYFQNDGYAWDPDKSGYVAELNNYINQIKVLNDSAVNGITYLVNEINTAGIDAPAYLVQDNYKLNHTHVPGAAGNFTYSFKNYGTQPQNNVRFKITKPTKGFIITSADSINVGTIAPGETKQISFSFTSPNTTDSILIGRYNIDVNADNGNFKDVTGSLYVLNASSALPVGLSGFANTCTDAGVKLTWQTQSEENSSHFDIENSSDGITWTTVGTYKAAGNSTVKQEYTFTDQKGGNAFYRLKQVDKDGRFTYSSIQKASCPSKQAGVYAYPVPAQNVLNVFIGAENSSKASIMLIDVLGRVSRQLNVDLKKGANNFKLNVAGLAAGQYFLRVAGTEIRKTQNVTIGK